MPESNSESIGGFLLLIDIRLMFMITWTDKKKNEIWLNCDRCDQFMKSTIYWFILMSLNVIEGPPARAVRPRMLAAPARECATEDYEMG